MRGTPSPLEEITGDAAYKAYVPMTVILSLGMGGKELGLLDCTWNIQL
jgi:hypothetical protein